MTDERNDYVMLPLDEFNKLNRIIATQRKEIEDSKSWEDAVKGDREMIKYLLTTMINFRVDAFRSAAKKRISSEEYAMHIMAADLLSSFIEYLNRYLSTGKIEGYFDER